MTDTASNDWWRGVKLVNYYWRGQRLPRDTRIVTCHSSPSVSHDHLLALFAEDSLGASLLLEIACLRKGLSQARSYARRYRRAEDQPKHALSLVVVKRQFLISVCVRLYLISCCLEDSGGFSLT